VPACHTLHLGWRLPTSHCREVYRTECARQAFYVEKIKKVTPELHQLGATPGGSCISAAHPRENTVAPDPSGPVTTATAVRRRICFAPRRNVLMACQCGNRVLPRARWQQAQQAPVLRGLEGVALQAFEFDADGEIIAVVAPPVAGGACVPGAVIATHELPQRTVTPDQSAPTPAARQVVRSKDARRGRAGW